MMQNDLLRAAMTIRDMCHDRKNCTGCTFEVFGYGCRLRGETPDAWNVNDKKLRDYQLEECPFCKGRAEMQQKRYDNARYTRFNGVMLYRVRCSECHAQSPYKANEILHGWHTDERSAADAWNRRADK